MTFTPRRALAFALLAGCSFLLSPGAAFAQDRPPRPRRSTEGDNGDPLYYRFEFGLYGGAQFFAQKHSLRQFSDDSELSSRRRTPGCSARGSRLT